MRRFLLGLLLACTGGFALAAAPRIPLAVPTLWSPPLPTAADAHAYQFPIGAEMLGDITYQTIVGYRPLKLDLYLPTHARGKLPLVVWIHGGGWEIGNPRADWTYGDWTQVLARLAARGYAVAAISYRFSAEAPFPAQIDDVHAALRFLRANAKLWHIDPTRVMTWGLSAGGHLSALAATESATAPPDERVQGAVVWFGPSDLSKLKIAPGSAAAILLACPNSGCSKAALQAASPVTYITPAAPPMLIMQGEADPLVDPAQAVELYQRLRAVGAPAQLIMLPGLGHGFTGASPAELQHLLDVTFDYFDQVAKSGR